MLRRKNCRAEYISNVHDRLKDISTVRRDPQVESEEHCIEDFHQRHGEIARSCYAECGSWWILQETNDKRLIWSTFISVLQVSTKLFWNSVTFMSVTLRRDDGQGFDTKWDAVLLSTRETPKDDILESMYTETLKDLQKLKTHLSCAIKTSHRGMNQQATRAWRIWLKDTWIRWRRIDLSTFGPTGQRLRPLSNGNQRTGAKAKNESFKIVENDWQNEFTPKEIRTVWRMTSTRKTKTKTNVIDHPSGPPPLKKKIGPSRTWPQ